MKKLLSILMILSSFLAFSQSTGIAAYIEARDSVGSVATPTVPTSSPLLLVHDGVPSSKSRQITLFRLQQLIGGPSAVGTANNINISDGAGVFTTSNFFLDGDTLTNSAGDTYVMNQGAIIINIPPDSIFSDYDQSIIADVAISPNGFLSRNSIWMGNGHTLLNNASNLAVFGDRNIVGDGVTFANGALSLVAGATNAAEAYGSVTTGIGARVLSPAFASGSGFAHAFFNGSGSGVKDPTVPYVTARGSAFNVSLNTAAQTDGFGALGAQSAILGGFNHNIPLGADNSAILGGSTIVANTDQNTVWIPKLKIGQGTGGALPAATATDSLLTYASDGTVGYIAKSTLGGAKVFDENYTKPAGDVTLDFHSNGGVVTHDIAFTLQAGLPNRNHYGVLEYNGNADVQNDDAYMRVFHEDRLAGETGIQSSFHRNYFQVQQTGGGGGGNTLRMDVTGLVFYDAPGTTMEAQWSEFGAQLNMNHPSGGTGIYDDSFTSNNSIEFTDGPTGGTTFFRAGEILGTQVTTNADPDVNLTDAANGVIAYDLTDHEFRGYVNGAWSTLGGGAGSVGTVNQIQLTDGAGGFTASSFETSGTTMSAPSTMNFNIVGGLGPAITFEDDIAPLTSGAVNNGTGANPWANTQTNALTLGGTSTAGASRTITTAGLAADVGLNLSAKGSGGIDLSSGSGIVTIDDLSFNDNSINNASGVLTLENLEINGNTLQPVTGSLQLSSNEGGLLLLNSTVGEIDINSGSGEVDFNDDNLINVTEISSSNSGVTAATFEGLIMDGINAGQVNVRNAGIGFYNNSTFPANTVPTIRLQDVTGTADAYFFTSNTGELYVTTDVTDVGVTGGAGTGRHVAVAGSSGTDNQIPFMNSTAKELEYSSNLTFDGTILNVTGQSNVDNLRLDANTLSSTDLNGNIALDPNGTGNNVLGNYTLDGDQTVGAGQDNFVMTYDNGTGLVSLEAATGGGGSVGAADQLDVADGVGGFQSTNFFVFANSMGAPDGSQSAPAYSFDNQATTGMFLSGADLDFSVSNSTKISMTSTESAFFSNLDLTDNSIVTDNNDIGTQAEFTAQNSSAALTEYANIEGHVVDNTNATEDAEIHFNTMQNGTISPALELGTAFGARFYGGIRVSGSITERDTNDDLVLTGNGTGDVQVSDDLDVTNGATFGSTLGNSVTVGIADGTLADTDARIFNILATHNSQATQATLGIYTHAGITNAVAYATLEAEDNELRYYWTDNTSDLRSSATLNDVGTTNGVVIGDQTSDIRLKDLYEFKYGLSEILKINPISFSYNYDVEKRKRVGFSAQEVMKIVPESVYDTNEPLPNGEEGETKLAMDYESLIPVLVKAIQEQNETIEELRKRVEALEGKN